MLEQNGMIRVACLVGGGEEWLWRKYCYWCQATTAMRMVAETRPFTLHNDAGLHWVQLFFFFFRSSIVWWWKVNVAWCVSTTMIHNAYISIGTLIFYFISNPKQFFLFLIWCYLLHRISYFGCSKHHVQFSLMLHVTIILVCFTLVVPSLCILPIFWLSC